MQAGTYVETRKLLLLRFVKLGEGKQRARQSSPGPCFFSSASSPGLDNGCGGMNSLTDEYEEFVKSLEVTMDVL